MNEKEIAKKHIHNIEKTAKKIERQVTLMEICGGHTNTIIKYGIRNILPKNIRLISGPGCPVCVSPEKDINKIIELAKKNIPIATYGDMLKVPGTKETLEKVKATPKPIIKANRKRYLGLIK